MSSTFINPSSDYFLDCRYEFPERTKNKIQVMDLNLDPPRLVRQSAVDLLDFLPEEKKSVYREFEYLVARIQDPAFSAFKAVLTYRAYLLLLCLVPP